MRYLIDSYAWIEYLDGSLLGENVKKILEGNNEIISLSITISEVIGRIKRKKGDSETAYTAITTLSKIVGITPEIAKEGGELHAKIREKIKDFGLVDALILTLSRSLNAKILTADKHFKGFKEAILLK